MKKIIDIIKFIFGKGPVQKISILLTIPKQGGKGKIIIHDIMKGERSKENHEEITLTDISAKDVYNRIISAINIPQQ